MNKSWLDADLTYCNDFKHIFNDYNDYVSSYIIVFVFIILLLLLHRYDMTIVFIQGHMTLYRNLDK
jgi:ascorbate-specific PTS system EIIC-type component UlaA